jgi:hypothetical protein
MVNTAIIRDAYGVPATFVGSKTGQDDAAFVFIRVGDEERRMRWGRMGRTSCLDGRSSFLGYQTLMLPRFESF